MTANFSIDPLTGRIRVVIAVVTAVDLRRQGHDLATALALSAAALGVAADVASRVVRAEAR